MKYFIILVMLTVASACNWRTPEGQEGKTMEYNEQDIRPSAFAGSWYSADPDELRQTIDLYLKHAKISHDLGSITGIIAPHAGYQFSGPVAAYAYKQILGKTFDTIVVVAPNHADPRLNFTSVLTRGAYTTPLGVVPVDNETAKAIVDFDKTDNVEESDIGHLTSYGGREEHSLELQLPFLQQVAGDFKLVPIVMGDRDEGKKSCPALANAIVSAVQGKNTLIVASSDLSHFHDVKTLKKMDNIVREHIEAYDPEGLLKDISTGKCEACGGLPIAAVMMACKQLGAAQARVLYMANSGDVSGDYRSPVGYLAAVISRTGENDIKEKEEKVGVELGLTEDEKEVLGGVVEQTLESVVNGGKIPVFDNYNGKLGEEWGAFVTLKKNGQLRGCIGHIVGAQPLIITVAEMAKAAALEDPRFPPVRPSELKDIDFEISVLTPIREVKDINEIIVGRDGIIITKGGYRGLLLPQVATDYGWERITFLEQTCVKARLPQDAWKDNDTKIEMFSAEVF
ncbi:AmmeMemoRadiSam system protein B [Candidatus Latescibacterota bacterium]